MEQEQPLIEAAQKDPRRFGELYEANFERVYAFVVRRVHDRHEAEDVTAEVFQHALANIARFEWRGAPLAAWLYRIAANVITDRSKQRSRQRIDPLTEDDLDHSKWGEIETRATMFQLVNALPEDQRFVLLKRFVDQMSIKEIAAQLDRSEGAIKQLQYRALETLRARAGGDHEQ
jgi:RNA polymerase sigma-70 factor (ECF subfamily)